MIKLVKQYIGNCEDLAKANRVDMAASTQSLKTVLEEDALIQEKVKVQDEKIEKLEIELTKVDSYQQIMSITN